MSTAFGWTLGEKMINILQSKNGVGQECTLFFYERFRNFLIDLGVGGKVKLTRLDDISLQVEPVA